jgi:hypothetical protein
MAEMVIPEHLAQQLRAIAERENRPVEEVLAEALRQYASPSDEASPDEIAPPPGTLARFAYEARKAGFRSGVSDTSERSREILETEFGDYLTRKMEHGE